MSDSSTGFAQEADKSEAATTEVSCEALGIGVRHTPGEREQDLEPGPGERVAEFQPSPFSSWGNLEQERCSL